MIQELTLTKVYRSDKDKEGKPLIGKTSGKPYTKISIKAQEYGDRWIGGFGNRDNAFWKEGDKVTLDVVENGQWLNFERVDEIKIVKQELQKINAKLDKLLGIQDPLGLAQSEAPNDEVADIDIPF